MQSFEDYEADFTPNLHAGGVPKIEREPVKSIWSNLAHLSSYPVQFEHAVELFDYCEARIPEYHERSLKSAMNFDRDEEADRMERNMVGWQLMAGRGASITVYHFGRTLDGIHKCLGAAPTLLGMLDRSKLRAARKLFDEAFPNSVQLRHGVAHTQEIMDSPRALARHAIKGPYELGQIISMEAGAGGIVMTDNLFNRTYTSQWEGKLFTLAISRDTLQNLIEVKRAYYGVFRPAVAPLREAAEAQSRPQSA